MSMREIVWETPFALLSYLVVASLRQRGVKGVGRMDKSKKLWAAFQKMQKEAALNGKGR